MTAKPQAQQRPGRLWAWFPVLLFLTALAPRLLAIGRYITPDELTWVYRSLLFREALLAGDWPNTLVAGHPGVITTWLGALAMSLQLLLAPAAQATYAWLTKLAYLTPDNMAAFQNLAQFLSAGRFAVALVNSLGVVLVYDLARRLFDRRIAALAALLLALDPFVAGLGGLLHVDALMATFAIIALLALALAVGLGNSGVPRPRYAVLAGVTAALAILTKSPALLLVPVSGLAILLMGLRPPAVPWSQRLRGVFVLGLVWLVSFGVVALLLFPALWSSPTSVLSFTSGNANRHIEEALRPTFFLGRVAYDHGPLFYPVALAWRLGPVVFVGLFVLLALLARLRQWPAERRWTVLLLAAWALLFLGGITLAAKKFDRYLLPVIPALTVLSALAWVLLGQRLAARRRNLLPAVLLGVQALYLLLSIPYLLAAYNPLVGGSWSARLVMPLGWGEAISASGRWLEQQPGTSDEAAISGIAPALAPFFSGATLPAEPYRAELADYVILTANSAQTEPDAVAAAAEQLALLHTVRFAGLAQGWVFANPAPVQAEAALQPLPTPVSFGGQMQLLAAQAALVDDSLLVGARWADQGAGRLLVRLRLLDDEGNLWAERETDLLNEDYFYPADWAPGETPDVTYALPLPPAAPPGEYTVALTVLDAGEAAALPVLEADGFGGLEYEVAALVVPAPDTVVDPLAVTVAVPLEAQWANGALRLLGHGGLPESAPAGSEIVLDLFWQALAPLPAGLQLLLQVDDQPPSVTPLSDYDTGAWLTGSVVQEKARLRLPAELPSGTYDVSVEPLDAGGTPLAGEPVSLGALRVEQLDRLFALPENIQTPLDVQFGAGVFLRGYDLAQPAAGGQARLVLYWQVEDVPGRLVNAFVHVLDDSGAIVAQVDRWPGGLPTALWVPGQVIVDEYALDLPDDLPAGDYTLAVGLYTTDDGVRLPIVDAGGGTVAGERFILPDSLRLTADE